MTGIQRLNRAFESGAKVLVPYVTAGDPDLQTTALLLDGIAESGADIIELGVPFSDPMADGPVLQLAAERALKNPINLEHILDVAAQFNTRHDVPVILFGYYNPFFRYGLERLAQDAKAAGVCGVLCVDLPSEEAEPMVSALRAEGLALIPLLTPTSDNDRIAKAHHLADAFGYYVSMTGVTGAELTQQDTIADRVKEVANAFGKPLVVGFGVRTPDDARRMAQQAHGVVVGSALVQLAFNTEAPQKQSAVRAFVADLKAAI